MIHIDGIIYTLQRRGGISVYFSTLAAHLRGRSIAAAVSIDGTPLDNKAVTAHVPFATVRPARVLERYRDCRVMPSASVFHSSYYRRSSKKSLPNVVTAYDFAYERFARGLKRHVHSRQKRLALRAAQAVICISQSTRDDLREFIGETPGQSVTVIHLAASDVFRPLALAAATVPFMLYVGERRGYKNFTTLAEALEFLPEVELHCVGGGPFRPEEVDQVPAGCRHRIRHLGFIEDGQLNEHYNRALCLAYPSKYEGFGIPVLEAMRAGCPVVATRCKAVMEIGAHALTVAASDESRCLADAVARLMCTEYRDRMVAAGLSVSANYSWSNTHEQTLNVYESLGACVETRP